ncbi:MAG: aminoacyl-tRNA hydrolase [Verrucomicrobia bacterium]|nr:aminoacyl-tRNA hydrolase [Verrucomicrobiota bacterium]
MENLYLIVGLGNPGKRYERTRHNAGFLAVDRLVRRWSLAWATEARFDARSARVDREGRRVLLVQPQTFMNRSGDAVGRYVTYYRVALDRMLVVVDDADLELGTLRLKPRGSSGGHHGLESIESQLGTREYARLRIGIGRRREGPREITDYVLGRFEPSEWRGFERVLERSADQMECWMAEGMSVAMNRYNGVLAPMEQESTE